MDDLWEFYLPTSGISRRELWTLAVESGMKIATTVKDGKLYAVVDGERHIVGELYATLQKNHGASDLALYRGVMPNFEAELEQVKLESMMEYTSLLRDIAENTSKLNRLSENLPKQVGHYAKK